EVHMRRTWSLLVIPVLLTGCTTDVSDPLEPTAIATEAKQTPIGFVATQLTIGSMHVCGISKPSRAWCWGENGHGELGVDIDDPMSHASAPVSVLNGKGMYNIAAGHQFTCALSNGGVP